MGVVAAVFHLWYAETMRTLTNTGGYFIASGVLFLVGAVLVIWKGSGFPFNLGAWGLFALSAIDNGLLFYTRTYGFGILSPLVGGPHFSGNFSGRPPFNGTSGFHPPPGGLGGGGFGWYSRWNPPGTIQFFVLQIAIMAIAVIAILVASRSFSHSEGTLGGSSRPAVP